jgi:hypothetical protein
MSMKTIYTSKRLTIRVPTTRIDWMCLFLVAASIYCLIAGKPRDAVDCLQLALLFEIIGRLPE